MMAMWYRGLLLRRGFRIWGTATGVAIAVALIVSLALFLDRSSTSMTARAASAVPIDWQVEVVPSGNAAHVADAIAKATQIEVLQRVDYAETDGFQASTGRTVQTTGPGEAIAFGPGYATDFPKEVRPLIGKTAGVLLAQQTAANLHAGPGDTVTIKRVGLPPAEVKVDGVVELPDADALFQGVGLPPGAAPQAPPDNVVILPRAEWHRIFDPQTAARPDSARVQFHVRIDHDRLPAAPTAAYTVVTGSAHNLEARVAGKALVADNLGARLDAVREDALYARVLFLFLGAPGILLAAALTITAAAANGARRRVEQALLSVRGASVNQIMALAAGEASLVAAIGIVIGGSAAAVVGRGMGSALPGPLTVISAILLGLALALASILVPAWRTARSRAAARRSSIGRVLPLPWERFYPDILLLAASGLLFWQSASSGYQIVLAPEGVAATAVDYKAFLAPALFWIGSALLVLRLARLALRPRQGLVAALVRPFAVALTPAVAATVSREAPRIALGTAMLALAVAFAVSTSIFNTTYKAQARVDAVLTNGSDVTVVGTTSDPAGAYLKALATLPDAAAAEPMQHRYAYVGADLQDMYGIDASIFGRATSLSDAYFSGAGAAKMLQRLNSTPDGVLVSEETVTDFQLKPGDRINLRLIDAANQQYHAVPFTFIGVVREFPTAPKDSFLVANAAYLAKTTHRHAAEYVLMKASGNPARLARDAEYLLHGQPGLKVKDIGSAAQFIGSSLTAVDLRGLTRIELAFALVMAAAASGLLLLLGFFERRRVFAVLDALGARPGQTAAFIWSEGVLVLVGGLTMGAAVGLAVAWMQVKLLSGVFDPPPEALSYPVGYLTLILSMVLVSTCFAFLVATKASVVSSPTLLREAIGV